jgi:hypothetical protein
MGLILHFFFFFLQKSKKRDAKSNLVLDTKQSARAQAKEVVADKLEERWNVGLMLESKTKQEPITGTEPDFPTLDFA